MSAIVGLIVLASTAALMVTLSGHKPADFVSETAAAPQTMVAGESETIVSAAGIALQASGNQLGQFGRLGIQAFHGALNETPAVSASIAAATAAASLYGTCPNPGTIGSNGLRNISRPVAESEPMLLPW